MRAGRLDNALDSKPTLATCGADLWPGRPNGSFSVRYAAQRITKTVNTKHDSENRQDLQKLPVTKPNPEGVAEPTQAAQAKGPTVWYLQAERFRFLPVKPPADWTNDQDKAGYNEIWGESDDYWRDTKALLEDDLAEVQAVLDEGIRYLASKRGVRLVVAPATLTMREKVILFTQLLPVSPEPQYTLRFSISLALLLWLDSERERITQQVENHRWLYPFYTLAESFLGVALELKESLQCEHDDFKQFSAASAN